jgi:hypothetical protein
MNKNFYIIQRGWPSSQSLALFFPFSLFSFAFFSDENISQNSKNWIQKKNKKSKVLLDVFDIGVHFGDIWAFFLLFYHNVS